MTARSWLPARQTSACSRASAAAVVGVGAVADDVAQAPDLRRAGAACDVGEHRLEGVAVAVDVGDDGDLHGSARPAWAVGHSLRTWNAPAGLPWPWLLPSSSRRRRSCCCGHVTASSRPCRSTPDRTSRPPSWSARATTATASSCSSPRARRSRWRSSCWLVRRPPRALRGPFRRPVLVAAGAGAALSVGFAAAQLPVSAISHQRAVDVGLSTQDWGPWLGDVGQVDGDRGGLRRRRRRGRAGAHAPLPARLVAARQRRSPSASPRPASTWARSSSTRSSTASRRCPRDARAPTCSPLAREAGVDVGRGLRGRRQPAHDRPPTPTSPGWAAPSASSSTTTCCKDFSRDEVRLVVAHELGHVHYRDVPRGLLYVALVAPGALFAAVAAHAAAGARTSRGPGRRRCRRWRSRSRS